jgi:hypothetical protein
MTMRERDLPIPDYDHLQVGSLTSRIRTLAAEDLSTLLSYERAHGNRFQVVRVMESRLAGLRAGAQPSGGAPDSPAPEASGAPAGESKAAEATSGPPVNPPPHGVPGNPSQSR